uniref:Type II site-specific deoxyribonuclease n=1 Tax=Geobacter sp. (strain M21) TaxID=443144 RepID=C6E3B4_GEOSM
MSLEIESIRPKVEAAVRSFWAVRAGGNGVLGGKTLDAFAEIIKDVVKGSLENAMMCGRGCVAEIPGFYRPHKSWDLIVIDEGKLVAAIEFKSQIGPIGNNFNNRTEEVLGSSLDLQTAIEENAFGLEANVFSGYIIVVEDSPKSRANPKIKMKYFPVMEGFLANEDERGRAYFPNPDGSYPQAKGISYIERYDLMCKRLMMKKLYTASAVITSEPGAGLSGSYGHVSKETSIEAFLIKLAKHCEGIAEMKSL